MDATVDKAISTGLTKDQFRAFTQIINMTIRKEFG
jgi:hypothetical protein